MTYKILVLTLLWLIRGSLSQCGTCSIYNIKCVNSTFYQYCQYPSGSSVGDPFGCPDGQVCSTVPEKSSPCSTAAIPDCSCGQCTGIFACVSQTQFRICQGGTPTGQIFTCPSGLQCDINFMGDFCSTLGQSGCSSSSVINTCTTEGRFPMLNTKCKSYYRCVLVNSSFIKYDYTCSDNAFYNPNIQTCSSVYICPTT